MGSTVLTSRFIGLRQEPFASELNKFAKSLKIVQDHWKWRRSIRLHWSVIL